jgi:hypothetical protein
MMILDLILIPARETTANLSPLPLALLYLHYLIGNLGLPFEPYYLDQGPEDTIPNKTKNTTCTDIECEKAYDVFGIP